MSKDNRNLLVALAGVNRLRARARVLARGAVVASQRGGDFLLEVGEDLSIGYESHGEDAVELYLVESFTFRVATPEAAVALTP